MKKKTVEYFGIKLALIFLADFFGTLVVCRPLFEEFNKDGIVWWEFLVILGSVLKTPAAVTLAYILDPWAKEETAAEQKANKEKLKDTMKEAIDESKTTEE